MYSLRYAAFAEGVWTRPLLVVNADDVENIPHQKSTLKGSEMGLQNLRGQCVFLCENGSIQLEEVHLGPAPAATTSVEECLFQTSEQEEEDEEDNLVEAEKDAVAANTNS